MAAATQAQLDIEATKRELDAKMTSNPSSGNMLIGNTNNPIVNKMVQDSATVAAAKAEQELAEQKANAEQEKTVQAKGGRTRAAEQQEKTQEPQPTPTTTNSADTGLNKDTQAPNDKKTAAVQEAQDKYADAKENEQSLANRTLSSLTMAATGIGGMELARGLAEQNADKAAQDEMNAYISTFQCKIGGKSYQGGTNGIEAPGANQLIKLYQEYVDLAASLKERKAALGLKPGIESDVVLDKAATGMYDDVGHGIENGTYASLYRAVKGNATDTQKLDDAASASKKRVIGGAVATGAGAVGGMVGNSAINGKLGELIKSSGKSGTLDLSNIDLNNLGLDENIVSAIKDKFGDNMSSIDTNQLNSLLQNYNTTGDN